MKYLHADNWDAVLAMFEKGGKFAGAWGFLEVLRQAELGDTSQVDYSGISKEGWRVTMTLLKGVFTEQDGYLMLSLSDRDVTVDAGLMGYLGSYNLEKVSYRVNQNYVGNYIHTHIVDRGVDWGGVAVAGTSLTLDLVSGGTVGAVKDFAKTSALVVDLTFGTIDFLKMSETGENVGETIFWDAVGFVPIAGDAAYIGYQLYENVYIGP